MENKNINLILAIILSVGIIFGWQYFYERPRLAKLAEQQRQYEAKVKAYNEKAKLAAVAQNQDNSLGSQAQQTPEINAGRVIISSDNLHGSIHLKGARFDDLTLAKYRQTLNPNSPEAKLFSHDKVKDNFFAEVGWYSNSNVTDLPNSNTVWKADKEELKPGETVNLTWINQDDIKFTIRISLDATYMFTITQLIENRSSKSVPLQFYGLINRNYIAEEKPNTVIHEGPIAVIEGKLTEYSYDKIKENKQEQAINQKVNWLGMSDKYWLSAFIPDQHQTYSAKFAYSQVDVHDKYQVDFITPVKEIGAGQNMGLSHRMFAGAKEAKLLDKYSETYSIPLFDRAIDFGWFYILTKPMLKALSFFYGIVGNFGISILIVTVLVKLLMFSLSNTSYRSMKRMKELQPEIERLKDVYGEDKVKFNQGVMALYKREKVNPLSGCLPILVQIPVFFSLYKVLYVSIEMRHAPFFGWIQDLSAPDPTSIFNLFGLLPFEGPALLTIGVWPILMSITMYLQQRLSPAPSDPVQAQVMKIMPVLFLVMFSKFPAGLVIYWTWSNILSILQQMYIMKLEGNDKKAR
ncbi:MAG: yidC [Rickettsiaceae bacterium]|nr:yidC [Rickettsiaceae bacterium]